MDEVGALVRPGIQSVGKVLLDRPPASDTFETGEPVLFSVAVAASAGVEDHEEISQGDVQEPEAHDHRFHPLRRLAVGELEASDGDHDLGQGHDEVGRKLPGHMHELTLGRAVDHELNEGDGNEGRAGHDHADGPGSQRG